MLALIASSAMLNRFMPRLFLLDYIICARYITRISIEPKIYSCPTHLLKVNLKKEIEIDSKIFDLAIATLVLRAFFFIGWLLKNPYFQGFLY